MCSPAGWRHSWAPENPPPPPPPPPPATSTSFHDLSGGAWNRRSGSRGQPVPTLRPPTPDVSRTAPATPVRESRVEAAPPTRCPSTPALEPRRSQQSSSTEWYVRDWVTVENGLEPEEEVMASREEDRPAESVLQKFRKSFSLKFARRRDEEDVADSPPDSPPPDPPLERFRFGPLVWRSSKERKKGKKAARNAKCNSGDSGIQMAGKVGGDSSESHDTDHLGDDEILDELDSPPVVRRRGTGSSSEGSKEGWRPASEGNAALVERLRAELARGRKAVRRTRSDLGGLRLYQWDRRPRTRPAHPLNPAQLRQLKRSRGRSTRLRRSVSQPLGINEISPLVKRKPLGVRQSVVSEDERGGLTTDDELHSDSESSMSSLNDRKKNNQSTRGIRLAAEAVWDHVAMEAEELAFAAGDRLDVLDATDPDWWWGAAAGRSGWFPSAFVRLKVSQEEGEDEWVGRRAAARGHRERVRGCVVTELLTSERDYVATLTDITEGYLAECRRRSDLFPEDRISSIFGNIEQVLRLQTAFLTDLESHIDRNMPNRSCIADTFLAMKEGFTIYSEYCNSQPTATATLQRLYSSGCGYSEFFEACRLRRGLPRIPLDGFLLTPVQRICKYPLQLAELLKYTDEDHEDYEKLREALERMRGVAVLVNERKRRMESLEKIALWQSRVDQWQGEELVARSSQLIHQCDAVRVTSGMWTSHISLFLFDHQLIYCKKDILKRNNYVYKGRMDLDKCQIISLNDGKDSQLGVTVRHALRINESTGRWLVFCLRSADEKAAWMEAAAHEREGVVRDEVDGLEPTEAMRALARSVRPCPTPVRQRTASTHPRKIQKGRSRSAGRGGDGGLGRRVGTWFTFGAGGKKSRAAPA